MVPERTHSVLRSGRTTGQLLQGGSQALFQIIEHANPAQHLDVRSPFADRQHEQPIVAWARSSWAGRNNNPCERVNPLTRGIPPGLANCTGQGTFREPRFTA